MNKTEAKDGRANNGGARAGAGRHKTKDKAQPVTLYFKNSFIVSNGGRVRLINHINKLLSYQK